MSEQPTTAPTWSVSYSKDAAKELERLTKRDPKTAHLIDAAMLAIAETGKPRSRGKALTADRKGQWRYRIGDWRVNAEIRDSELVILAVKVGHRSTIYSNKRKR